MHIFSERKGKVQGLDVFWKLQALGDLLVDTNVGRPLLAPMKGVRSKAWILDSLAFCHTLVRREEWILPGGASHIVLA